MPPNSAAPESSQTRRGFLNTMLGFSAVAWFVSIFYPISKYLIPPESSESNVKSVKVGTVDQFEPDSGTIFKFGRKPGILICTPDGEFRAFRATCTHLDCTVQYRRDFGQIWCACHNGKYNTHGINVSGPPPRPLEAFHVIVKGDEIFVSV